MKLRSFIFLYIIFGHQNLVAQTKVFIARTDEIDTIAIDSIEKLTFVKQPPPKYHDLEFWSISNPPGYNPRNFSVTEIDSITFSYDPFGNRVARIGKWTIQIDHQEGSDSITFSSHSIDTNLLALPYGINDYDGTAIWYSNRIYTSHPGRYVELDSAFRFKPSKLISPDIGTWLLSIDSSGSKLLSIGSKYVDISMGWLRIHDLNTHTDTVLDSVHNISSALFFPGTDSIVYYSFGSWSDTNQSPTDAGYYLLEPSGKRSLLLHYISEIGPRECINGFDIRSDGQKLLIPVVRSQKPPLIVEYDLLSHTFDTIAASFDTIGNPSLWLRYNHDGSKILFNNYPFLPLAGNVVFHGSETGIITLATGSKQRISTSPDDESIWVSLFPNWSPTEKSIVYVSAPILREPPDMLSNLEVYILKKFP